MKKPFTEITTGEIWLTPFSIYPPDGYVELHNDETGQKYPHCCPSHKDFFAQAEAWYEKFPLCCDTHAQMARSFSIDKQKYSMMPMQAVQAMAFTEHIIEQKMDSEDWYEDITDYVAYIQYSFGKPAMGLHLYLGRLMYYLKNNIAGLEKAKTLKLLEFLDRQFEDPQDEQTDWNVLNDMYQKWLKEFPFDLPFFSSIKEQYHRPKMFFRGAPKRNRYINIVTIKLHTRSSLMDELVNLTDKLLCSMNSLILHDNGQLTDPQKLSAALAISKRRSELNRGYKNDSPNEEQRYRRMLKQWYKDEQEFIRGITPALKQLAPPIDGKTQKVIDSLNQFKFAEYLTEKGYKPAKVYSLIAEYAGREQTPFCIALMDETGFLKYLINEFGQGKLKGSGGTANKLMVVFGCSERLIMGNINALQPNSNDRKTTFRSWKYKETMAKRLEGTK